MKCKYYIYFSKNDLMHSELPKAPAILLSASLDNWNDFGYKNRFDYRILCSDDQQISGHLNLAFLDSNITNEDPSKYIFEKLKLSSTGIFPANENLNFYTMHIGMNSYRELVNKCGFVKANEILLAMNDLVAIKRAGRVPGWFKQATTSELFTKTFVRHAESLFAFYNAGSILGGLDQESFDGITTHYRLTFKMSAFSNKHILNFNFDCSSELPKRISVVIGKNGVGKSQTLAHFSKSLLRGMNLLTDKNGNAPLINRLMAVSSPGETKNTFPPAPKNPRIFYQRIMLGRNTFVNRQPGMGELLKRLVHSPESIKAKSRWDLFSQAVGQIVPTKEIAIKLKHSVNKPSQRKLSHRAFVMLSNFRDGGEEQRLERWSRVDMRADPFRLVDGKLLPLSSGQLTFIRFAAQACLNIENGTMVLFDEPETHLHPNYVTDFIRLLDKLLEETGSLAILATHSAYFVREVARSQVIVLRQTDDGQIEVSTPRLKTLGADIGEISHFVFEDKYFGAVLGLIRSKIKHNPDIALEILKSLEGEVSTEALMSLQRELPSNLM